MQREMRQEGERFFGRRHETRTLESKNTKRDVALSSLKDITLSLCARSKLVQVAYTAEVYYDSAEYLHKLDAIAKTETTMIIYFNASDMKSRTKFLSPITSTIIHLTKLISYCQYKIIVNVFWKKNAFDEAWIMENDDGCNSKTTFLKLRWSCTDSVIFRSKNG